MKTCSKCGRERELGEFSFDRRRKDGYCTQCKSCKKKYRLAYYKANREKACSASRKWAIENPEKVNAIARKWCKKNHFKSVLTASRSEAKRKGFMPCSATPKELEASYTGRCGICEVPELECSMRLSMDHSHETGEFRGWLCRKCNRALGGFSDSEELLINALHFLMNCKVKK